MPLWDFWRILIRSFRSLQMLGRNWYQSKTLVFEWKKPILVRKCIANGIIDAVWFSLPISVSIFLAIVFSFDKMYRTVIVQDMNLGSGKLTHNVSGLYTYHRTTLISSNAPSDFPFDGSIILSLGTNYFWDNSRETAWIASVVAAFPLELLFPISGMTVMQSSRYMSIFPWGSTDLLTAEGLLWGNKRYMSWVDGGGIKYWFGALVSCGYQVSSKSRALPRSAIGLSIVLHSAVLLAPPKVSLSDMETYNFPFQFIWVAYWIVACADKCCRR